MDTYARVSGHSIETVPRKADLPKTYRVGRLCSAGLTCPPGTRLSIYNGADLCAPCEVEQRRRERRVEREPTTAQIMSEAPGPR